MTTLKSPTTAKVSNLKVTKAAPLTQSEPVSLKPQGRLPVEVWQGICEYLFPSQLIRLSKTSSMMHRVVCTLPFWSKLFALTHDTKSRLHLLPGIPDSQSYMHFMVAISSQVCEQCYKQCDFETHRPSDFPLATVSPSQTRCTKDLTYHGEPIDKTFMIRLCLQCRRDFFEIKPEPTSIEMKEKMASFYEMKLRYPHIQEVPSIRDGGYYDNRSYLELTFLKEARKLHGGDVGIAASRTNLASQKVMTDRRLEKYTSLYSESHD